MLCDQLEPLIELDGHDVPVFEVTVPDGVKVLGGGTDVNGPDVLKPLAEDPEDLVEVIGPPIDAQLEIPGPEFTIPLLYGLPVDHTPLLLSILHLLQPVHQVGQIGAAPQRLDIGGSSVDQPIPHLPGGAAGGLRPACQGGGG